MQPAFKTVSSEDVCMSCQKISYMCINNYSFSIDCLLSAQSCQMIHIKSVWERPSDTCVVLLICAIILCKSFKVIDCLNKPLSPSLSIFLFSLFFHLFYLSVFPLFPQHPMKLLEFWPPGWKKRKNNINQGLIPETEQWIWHASISAHYTGANYPNKMI